MIIGLIPSRLNSKRLKNKPLINIDGLPLIVHSFKRAKLSKKLNRVIVCTDDIKIKMLLKVMEVKLYLLQKNIKMERKE